MMRRWRHHPNWQAVARSLASGEDPHHTLILLNVASYLVDANNGVGIHDDPREDLIPDMWVEPNLDEKVQLEVKAPEAFRSPKASLSVDDAEEVVEKAYAKAKRQLKVSGNGLLVIGGFQMGPTLDVAERAAKRWASSRKMERRGHVIGVILADMSYRFSTGSNLTMLPCLNVRHVANPAYAGGLDVSEKPAAWSGG